MTGFDGLLIGLIALSVALAAYRGGLAELATLVALGFGGIAGLGLAQPLAGALGRSDSTITILVIGAAVAALIFVGALVALSILLGRLRLDRRQRLADRIGGGAFGFFRALALIGLGFLGYAYYLDADKRPPAVADALLLPLAQGSAGIIASLAPAREPLNVKGGEPSTGGVADPGDADVPASDAAAEDEDGVAAIIRATDS